VRRALILCLLLASAIIGCKREAHTYIIATGTAEVTQTDIASLYSARVLEFLVGEGDSVRAGDTLVRLTQSTLSADIDMRRARIAAADAALRDLEAGSRPQEISARQAELNAADAEVERLTKELERAGALLRAQAVSQAEVDALTAAVTSARSRREAIVQTIALLQEGSREQRIQAARAEAQAARASLAAALAVQGDLVLTAPVNGVVLGKHAEAGEIIAPGTATLTVGDLSLPWVRVFVAAPVLPKLRVGQEGLAQVAGVEELFPARIVAIDAQAQFTPRVALTKDERADLMFGVKVHIAQHAQLVKPGLPVDVHFDTSGTGLPESLTRGRTVHKQQPPNGGG
jgi:HlyD family secretion protein